MNIIWKSSTFDHTKKNTVWLESNNCARNSGISWILLNLVMHHKKISRNYRCRIAFGRYNLGFLKNRPWVLIKILYIFSLSCKLMMFWTWVFNVLQMYHHSPSNRPYRTATSRTRLWQEGSKLRIFEKKCEFRFEKSSPEFTFCISDELKVLLQDIQIQVWKCTGQKINGKSRHT